MDKEKEAESHYKEGKKAAKSGFFKKPDWDTAAGEFEKAAQAYQFLKQLPKAKEIWLETSEAHYKAKNYFFAGKALENAAKICQDTKDSLSAAAFLEQAGNIYNEDGKPKKMADLFVRASKLLAESDSTRAADLLLQAVAVFEETKKWHLSSDAFRLLISLYLKLEQWETAVSILQRQFHAFGELNQPHNVLKGSLEVIVIWLYAADEIRAQRAYDEAISRDGSFLSKDEGVAASQLLEAFEARDPERLAECTQLQVFSFLMNEIARMVKKLKIVGFSQQAPAKKPVTQQQDSQFVAGVDGGVENPENSSNVVADENLPTADVGELQEPLLI